MKKVVLIFFIIFSSDVFAIEESELEYEFAQYYYSAEISSRHCGLNIKNFVNYLLNQGHDVSGINIVTYRAETSAWGFGRILALYARDGKLVGQNFIKTWEFHVIALYNRESLRF